MAPSPDLKVVGGGSLAWPGWSPRPLPSETAGWRVPVPGPDLWARADAVLGIREVPLTPSLERILPGLARSSDVYGDVTVEPARLALGDTGNISSPLASLRQWVRNDGTGRLRIVPNVEIDGIARREHGLLLSTSAGNLLVPSDKDVFVACGTIESIRLAASLTGPLAEPELHVGGHLHSSLDIYHDASDLQAFGHVRARAGTRHVHVQVTHVPTDRSEWPARLHLSAVAEAPSDALRLVLAWHGGRCSVTVLDCPDLAEDPAWEAVDQLSDDLAVALLADSGARQVAYAGSPGAPLQSDPPARKVEEQGGRRWSRVTVPSGGMDDMALGARAAELSDGQLHICSMASFGTPGAHNGGVTNAALAIAAAREAVARRGL